MCFKNKVIVKNDDFPDGDIGVDETVKLIKKLAIRDSTSKEIRFITDKIKFASKNNYDKVKLAFDYVVKNVNYKFDPEDVEYVVSPRCLIKDVPYGDCDCMSCLLCSMLIALSVSCWVKVIAHKLPQGYDYYPFSHIYVLADIGGDKIIPLDPVMKEAGFFNELGNTKKIHRDKIYKIY